MKLKATLEYRVLRHREGNNFLFNCICQHPIVNCDAWPFGSEDGHTKVHIHITESFPINNMNEIYEHSMNL